MHMNAKDNYKFNAKLYVAKMKHCICFKKVESRYFLNCKIARHGKHEYQLSECGDDISGISGKKRFLLSSNAQVAVQSAIGEFKADVFNAKRKFIKIEIAEIKTTLYYKHVSKKVYDFLVEKENNKQENELYFYNKETIETMLRAVQPPYFFGEKFSDFKYKKMCNLLDFCDKNSIKQNPIYIFAFKTNDILMQSQIKSYYKAKSEKSCSLLAKKLGLKILPQLSSEFNKDYVVDATTIKKSLLKRSGYKILHNSWASMLTNQYTVLNWKLNPYSKYAETKAEKELPAISFDEYLKLFE